MKIRVLGAFGYSTNRTFLHRDESFLPTQHAVRASWNYRLDSCHATDDRTRVSYWMNRLQGHPESAPLVVTLNPGDDALPGQVIDNLTFYLALTAVIRFSFVAYEWWNDRIVITDKRVIPDFAREVLAEHLVRVDSKASREDLHAALSACEGRAL